MIAFTRKTDYALIALASLAQEAGDPGDPAAETAPLSARAIAERYAVPLPILMNVLKGLAGAELIRSTRGVKGGYILAAPPPAHHRARRGGSHRGTPQPGHVLRGLRGGAVPGVPRGRLLSRNAFRPSSQRAHQPFPARGHAGRSARRQARYGPGHSAFRPAFTQRAAPRGRTREVMSLSEDTQALHDLAKRDYKYGFVTDIEQDSLPPGLDEDVVRAISAIKGEPEWMTEWRLKAFRHWLTMSEPAWPNVHYPPIDYQAISYYSAPKRNNQRLDEVDPKLLRTYEKLGVPLEERARARRRGGRRGVRLRVGGHHVQGAQLAELGIVFCSFSEAVREHPELVRKYLGSVVPYYGQFLRSAELRGLLRRFVRLHPQGRHAARWSCRPTSASTRRHRPVRAHADRRRQRAPRSATSKAAPPRCATTNQLHAAVVELVALDDANIKYSHVQNWYAGRQGRQGRHLQLRDQARAVQGRALRDLVDAGRDRGPRSPGSTRAASCAATTRSASSTRWR